ncbi:MAG: enoyl-CoA hydratase/isomerase family protein, partial [Chloroflexi bacterium]|nr:enoyl-CoA hydratase/isomerase family protein [Chloroflexota bacterium]
MPIHYEIKNRIAFITIEGRGNYNLFNPDMVYRPLKKTLESFRDDPEVWVGVVSAPQDKKVFTYGGDVHSVSAIKNKLGDESLHRGYNLSRDRVFRHNYAQNEWSSLLELGELKLYKPLLFAINGPCLGAGMEVMMACSDYTVASPDTKFGLTGLKHGIGGGGSHAQQLTRQLPWRIAMDMILRARFMDAEEALRYGFINQIAPHDRLMSAAVTIAEEFAAMPPLHV